jgi:hypothetical protein
LKKLKLGFLKLPVKNTKKVETIFFTFFRFSVKLSNVT